MFEQLEEVERRFDELTQRMSDPSFGQNIDELKSVSKERSKLDELVSTYRLWRKTEAELKGAKELLESNDDEIREMAKLEIRDASTKLEDLQKKLEILLIPKDPLDGKNVILEIRAGAGGDEASLFAGELFNTYQRFAVIKGWKIDIMN